MAETIGSEVASGALSGADATALTNALGAIRSSLASGGAPAASTSDTASRRDPAAMRSRIDGLIAEQVGNGTLTSDQASELKNLFASHGRSTTASTETGRAQGSHVGRRRDPGRRTGRRTVLASGGSASAADALSSSSSSSREARATARAARHRARRILLDSNVTRPRLSGVRRGLDAGAGACRRDQGRLARENAFFRDPCTWENEILEEP